MSARRDQIAFTILNSEHQSSSFLNNKIYFVNFLYLFLEDIECMVRPLNRELLNNNFYLGVR